MKKKEIGITLIALVITIIVLLILAGVTINAIVGNNSSMEKAKEARIENEKGNELDTIKLAVTDAMVKETDGTIHLDKLNESLTGLVKGEATGDSPWIVTGNTGYKYRITSYGEVTLSSTVDIVRNNQIVTDKIVKVEATEIGHTVQLTAEPTPDVTLTSSSWASSNTGIATIDNTGLVTIVAEGQTTITLTAVTSIGNITKTCNLKVGGIQIGDSVNYSTSLNEVTLDNWKVFYIDGDYTYIIYGDYVLGEAVSNIVHPLSYFGNCVVDPTLNQLITKSNWSDLLIGTLNGNSIDYSNSTDINIYAMGGTTIELFANSWNTKHSNKMLYYALAENGGYYVGLTENPTTDSVQLLGDLLYFPHNDTYEGANGYWLASKSSYR